MPIFDLKAFRNVALLEASSFLILLFATFIKYTFDAPVGVQIMGPIHGALFIIYVALAVLVRPQARWNVITTLLVLLGAVVPFGGFIVDRKLLQPAKGQASKG